MLESPEIREAFQSLLQALRKAEIPVHDLKDDLARGGLSVVELMRRMSTASEDILSHCVARGMNPGCSDRKLIVVVFEILREFESYRSPLSVDHFLKPGQYLKGKFQVLLKFARYLRVVKDKDLSHAESAIRPHKRLSELSKDTSSSRAHRGEAPLIPSDSVAMWSRMTQEAGVEGQKESAAGDETNQTSLLKPLPSVAQGDQGNQGEETLGNENKIAKPSRRVTHTGEMSASALDLSKLRSPLAAAANKGANINGGGEDKTEGMEKSSRGDEGVVSGKLLEGMGKQFADSQSMMRMILSLSKRIRTLEDYGGSLDSMENTSSLLHTAPHKQMAVPAKAAGGESNRSTPTRGIHASPGRAGAYRNSIAGPSAAGSPGKKATLCDTLYGGQIHEGDGGETSAVTPSLHTHAALKEDGAAAVASTNEELGTAYIDLLFSLLEKKMRANFYEETRAAVNSAVAASEKRSAEQMKTLVSEIDKIHGNFDQRLTKLETTIARDRLEKRMEEQEMGKLIANSAYSPASNIARFRMTQALSGSAPASR